MQVMTKHFGEVEIEDSKLVTFDKGIYGFEALTKYVILYDNENEQNQAFCWLQSLDDKDICLPMIDPIAWFPTYSPEVDDEAILSIGELNETELSVFSVIVVPDQVENITVNLKAPIIINKSTLKGVQVIAQGEEYQVRHRLYTEQEEDGE